MTNTTKLKNLLAEHARLTGERARHEQTAVTLQAEESSMMETVNLENKAEFEKISQLRLRREIVPRKIKQFQEAAERIKADLAEECSKATTALLGIIRAKIDTQVAKIAKTLEPVIPTETAAAAAAEKIVSDIPGVAILIESQNRLNNENFIQREAIGKANELLKHEAITGEV
jgi:hypothetical protein